MRKGNDIDVSRKDKIQASDKSQKRGRFVINKISSPKREGRSTCGSSSGEEGDSTKINDLSDFQFQDFELPG